MTRRDPFTGKIHISETHPRLWKFTKILWLILSGFMVSCVLFIIWFFLSIVKMF